MHHLLQRIVPWVGQVALAGSQLVRGTTQRGDRAKAACSFISWVNRVAVITQGQLALNPAIAIGNDLAGARYDLVVECFGHRGNSSKRGDPTIPRSRCPLEPGRKRRVPRMCG